MEWNGRCSTPAEWLNGLMGCLVVSSCRIVVDEPTSESNDSSWIT
jgi:hypothetical protein